MRIFVAMTMFVSIFIFQSCALHPCEETAQIAACGVNLEKELPVIGKIIKKMGEQKIEECKNKTDEKKQRETLNCMKKNEKSMCPALKKSVEDIKKVEESTLDKLVQDKLEGSDLFAAIAKLLPSIMMYGAALIECNVIGGDTNKT